MAKPKEVESKEVAKVQTAGLPAPMSASQLAMMKESAGVGKDFAADDLAIPRFGIVQSLSPQRNKQKPEYIDGAEEGMIYNSLSKELWNGDDGIIVLPVKYQKSYLEWAQRNDSSKKGLQANHGSDPSLFNSTPIDPKTHKRITKDGNVIQVTAEYFLFAINEETLAVTPGVMSMASVFLKQAKRWNGLISLQTVKGENDEVIELPIFGMSYKITTVPESNENGNWFRQEITPYKNVFELANGEAIYKKAIAFRKSVEDGAVKVAEPEQEPSAAATESDTDPM